LHDAANSGDDDPLELPERMMAGSVRAFGILRLEIALCGWSSSRNSWNRRSCRRVYSPSFFNGVQGYEHRKGRSSETYEPQSLAQTPGTRL